MNAITDVPIGIPNTTLNALIDVSEERHRQDERWGEQNHDMFVWAAILSEETGEVAEAALTLANVDELEEVPSDEDAYAHLREELVQVAAVAVAAIESLDRQRNR